MNFGPRLRSWRNSYASAASRSRSVANSRKPICNAFLTTPAGSRSRVTTWQRCSSRAADGCYRSMEAEVVTKLHDPNYETLEEKRMDLPDEDLDTLDDEDLDDVPERPCADCGRAFDGDVRD